MDGLGRALNQAALRIEWAEKTLAGHVAAAAPEQAELDRANEALAEARRKRSAAHWAVILAQRAGLRRKRRGLETPPDVAKHETEAKTAAARADKEVAAAVLVARKAARAMAKALEPAKTIQAELGTARRAWKAAAKKRTEEAWLARIIGLLEPAMAAYVACICWWDFFADKPPAWSEGLRKHMEAYRDGPGLTQEAIRAALVRIGWPASIAADRISMETEFSKRNLKTRRRATD